MALTPGTVSITGVTSSTVSLSATPALNGVGTVTYQWYRSTQYNFTPDLTNVLSGQTALQLDDVILAPNAIYYYVLQATDQNVPPAVVSYPTVAAVTLGSSVSGFKFPQVADFKQQFFRDFPYGTDISTTIMDVDIAVALQMANTSFFNPIFFGTQATFSSGFLLLAAHYLVMNIRKSSQGLNGQFNFLQQSKGVGGVSESFGIPERILQNPDFNWLCKTNYGAEYLAMVLPQLTGQMFPVLAVTNP